MLSFVEALRHGQVPWCWDTGVFNGATTARCVVVFLCLGSCARHPCVQVPGRLAANYTFGGTTPSQPNEMKTTTSRTSPMLASVHLRQLVVGVLVGSVCLIGGSASAETDEQVTVKQLQGTVSAVNAQGIAVEFARTKTTSKEMYLPFVPQVRVQGVRRVTELQPGDTVSVEYREVTSKDEHGEYTKVNRMASGITLIARVSQQPVAVPDEGLDAKSQ